MNRNKFLKSFLGASTLITMDGFAHLVDTVSNTEARGIADDFASFGAIHLNITNLEKSLAFYTKIVGLKVRKTEEKVVELGTEDNALVVLHEAASSKFKKGYSGLYHFAIHAPNRTEFASMINRLNRRKYPYSPVDHTMSKSIYLDDPDGINVEFTLETPEEFKRVVTTSGLKIEGSDGVIRSASDRLNVQEMLKFLDDTNIDRVISNDSYLGHIHLYANNVDKSTAFYKNMDYESFNYLPQFKYSDLGAGGDYKHRVALNSWHGDNRPLAPEGSAGMRHFQINYKSKTKLCTALAAMGVHEEKDGGFWLADPTGNKVLFTYDA